MNGISIGAVIAGIVLIGCGVVCALKAKWIFFILGVFSGVFWIIGAARLGKPKSVWARWRYDDARMAEAWRRFERRPVPRLGKTIWW